MTEDLFPVDPEELARLAASDAARAGVPLSKWPKALVELIDCTRAVLLRAGQPEEAADRLARLTVQGIAALHGGRMFYLPIGVALDEALRDDRIYRDMGRIPADVIAQREKISLQQAYAINRQQTALRRKALQSDLF